jgi:two-component system NtrC family sensor kinase
VDLEHEKALEFVEGLKRQWMAMIDALVDPLMIVREDYTILKANRALAQMYGKQSVKEVLGLKCYTVFAARTSPCPGCQLKIAAKTQVATHGTLDEIREGRYFETVSQPVFDSEGSLEGVVQLYRDRTDARRMQNQLLQSEKLASIGLLAGGVAHEINNPLGGILIFSQMILREMDKSSPHYSDVVEIENATQRCKEIVERLLDFARQRPEKPGALKDVSLVEVVDRALKFASVGPNANKADVKQNWKNPEAIVKADSNKLIQVFLNLLQNAIHAIKKGGKIIIRDREVTEDKIDYIVVDIEDSGSGMAPHTLKRIFDPFFTTKEPGEGTGLGLAICYSIMTEFKGKLTVKSELGVGTIFSVWFPKVN